MAAAASSSSTTTDSGSSEAAYKRLYFFISPVCNTDGCEFDKMAVKKVSEEARDNLKVVANARLRVARVLDKCKDPAVTMTDEIRRAIGEYLPYVYTIVKRTEGDENVQQAMKKKLKFQWMSILSKQSSGVPREAVYDSFRADCAHMFFYYGVAHYQMAQGAGNELYELMESASAAAEAGTSEAEKKSASKNLEAVRNLKKAAGIFTWVATKLIPYLEPLPKERPPETTSGMAAALAVFCRASAQELSIAEATRRKTSDATMAKLCEGASELFDLTLQVLKKEGTRKQFESLRTSFKEHLVAKYRYYRAMGRMFLGKIAWAAEEYGNGAGYYGWALELFKKIKITQTKNPGNRALGEFIASQRKKIEAVHAEAKSDVERVYYATVPDRSKLPSPSGAHLIKDEPYEPPELVESSFFGYDPKTSSCAVM